MQPVIFETDRLFARSFVASDWRRLQSIGGPIDVAGMMATLKSPWPEADVKAWLAQAPYTGKVGFGAAICLKSGGLIGFVGLGGDPVSCAYAIDPEYAGQGYATEALSGLMAHAFDVLEVRDITADHFTDNPASGRVMIKTGFVKTGTGMGDSLARTEPAPNVTYTLTPDAFRAGRP